MWQVLEWLDLPKGERPHFITAYFDEPDHTGHSDGPGSEGVSKMVTLVDSMIKRVRKKLFLLSVFCT